MPPTVFPATGFLADSSDELKEVLGELARRIVLDKGDVLFSEGDQFDALYAVMSGGVEVSVLSGEGRKLSLDMMRPGALFGEIALFDPGPRTATLNAAEPSSLLQVRNQDVLRALRERPEVAIDLIALAGRRMRWMNQQLHEQVFLPMPTRLARKILYLTPEKPGKPGTLALSQSELAEFVGATREAVSKTLSSWRKQNIVELSRGGLTLLDRQALRALADHNNS